MIGDLLIAVPGYGLATLFTYGAVNSIRYWLHAEPDTKACRESFGAAVIAAVLAMASAYVTRQMLGGAP
jgi:hypothetical protein